VAASVASEVQARAAVGADTSTGTDVAEPRHALLTLIGTGAGQRDMSFGLQLYSVFRFRFPRDIRALKQDPVFLCHRFDLGATLLQPLRSRGRVDDRVLVIPGFDSWGSALVGK